MIWSRLARTCRVAAIFGLTTTMAVAGCGQDVPTRPEAASGSGSLERILDASLEESPAHPSGKDKRKLPPGLFRNRHRDSTPDYQDPVDPWSVLVEVGEIPAQGTFLSNGATIIEEYPEIGMVKVVSLHGMAAVQLARLLQNKAGVISAEPDRFLRAPESQGMPISFNDGEFDAEDVEHQPFLERLHVSEAHAVALGRGIRLAILDTGADPSHPALVGRLLAGSDLVDHDDFPWEVADGVDNDGDGLVDEAFGHGTHVAGLIAMLAPEAELDVYRVLDDEGWGAASNVAKGILRAVKDGADVINLSLGMYDPFRAVEKALEYATERGVVVITAAGNDGVSQPGQYPASYPLALGVGSADAADRLSGFSNYGPAVHVTAPGEQVLSCYPGGGYASASGTSMATAVVSALAALIVEHNQMTERSFARSDDVSTRIAQSSVAGTGLPGLTGHGRVDYWQAVRR